MNKALELTERKLKILQAVISDYVRTAEPVGSRTLSRRPELRYSPATIRNEMSDLELMGFLTHPHTSAGRVPSDRAYRLYVNQLMEKEELAEEDKKVIAKELQTDISEFENSVKLAARILSRITKLTSFAVTPARNRETLEYIKFIPINSHTVVMMVVSNSGEVSNTALSFDFPVDEANLTLLAKSMTYEYRGRTLTDVLKNTLIENLETNVEAMRRLARGIMPDFIKTLEDMLNVQLYMSGLSNIFDLPEYNNIERARHFLSLMEQEDDFIRLLNSRGDGLVVTIGKENSDQDMDDYAMITCTYSVDGTTVGKLGVIGPKRMPYARVTSIMEYLTENLNDSFKIGDGMPGEE